MLQLTAFSFALACVRLGDARFLSVSVPTHWGVEEQRPAVVETEPERKHSSQSVRQAGALRTEQTTVEPLYWKYPGEPAEPAVRPPVGFKLKRPVAADSVAVRCGESKVFVEVSQDLFGLGKLVTPGEVTLGGCPAVEIDDFAHVLIFESELHGCGSKLVMIETTIIYAFTLVYNPRVLGSSPIIRSQRAVIGVECHYPR
ncbi:zona pellucida sperm-binding protein 3-like [Mugil cephalus]|uniref:zona pellucida sperm-binding protein 3-like n=1 Tax=Mugil cephalus TaxID=48193 RepID=UPI001FB7BB77|nr:zona pellucida sperm-binding protein 3-like [Mugil cephalus]